MPVVRTQRTDEAEVVTVTGQGHTPGLTVTPTHRFWARPSRYRHTRRDNLPVYGRVHDEPGWHRVDTLIEQEACWAAPTRCEPAPAEGVRSRSGWWTIGRWLGDGSFERGGVSICCGDHEADDLEKCLADDDYGPWHRRQLRTATVFTLWNVALADWYERCFGRGAAGKGLPGWVFGLPEEDRRSLLDGYVSADGCIGARRVQTDTVSKKLALSMRLLAESLGHRACVYRYEQRTDVIEGRKVNVRPLWKVTWERTPTTREAFEVDGHAWSRVRRVTPAGRATVYNLEVAEDHSYVAEGVVVKNCTNHSLAKGRSRKTTNPSLFETDQDAARRIAAERSRATMFDVIRFAEFHQYEAVIVENVVDARTWVLWPTWWDGMTRLGYDGQCVYFNSMFAPPTPQSRDRMYVVWTRRGAPRPNLDLRPPAWCGVCERIVGGVQSWRDSRKPWGKYRQQYDYRCPTCGRVVDPVYTPAAAAIDWTLPAPRIGDRKRPLAAATLRRIEAGLRKYGIIDSAVTVGGNTFERDGSTCRYRPVDQPMRTQSATPTEALVQPFIAELRGGGSDARSVGEALATIVASGNHHGLVEPPGFVGANRAHNQLRPADDAAMSTITTAHGGGLYTVVPPAFLMRNNTARGDQGQMVTPVDEPMRTLTTAGHQSLLMPYNRTGVPRSVGEAMGTLTTKDRFALVSPAGGTWADESRSTDEPLPTQTARESWGLVTPLDRLSDGWKTSQGTEKPLPTQTARATAGLATPAVKVEDCGFRMLEPAEIGKGMAFPTSYVVKGTKRDRVRQYGNAVTPPVLQILAERVAEALGRS
jgi:DNA (cytosine-5)-methyltransferase 1